MTLNFFSLIMSVVFGVKGKLKDRHAKLYNALQRILTKHFSPYGGLQKPTLKPKACKRVAIL